MEHLLIIGAGVAGLYAGQLLQAAGYAVQILEARDRIGGRVHTSHDFADHPVELGAEFVHGQQSVLFDWCQANGLPLVKETTPAAYIYGSDLQSFEQLCQQSQAIADFFDYYDQHHRYAGPDVSLEDFLHQHEVWDEVCHYAEAMAAEYGTSADRLGVWSLAKSAFLWKAGHENYRLPQGYDQVIAGLSKGLSIHTQKAVTHIRYAPTAEVLTADGTRYTAERILLTVPLSVLQKGGIAFDPVLPEWKQWAIQKIGIGQGLKILLRFRDRFWGDRAEMIGSRVVAEYWTSHPSSLVLTAFAMGRQAEALMALPAHRAAEEVIAELDELFAGVASKTIADVRLVAWDGAYSYPAPGSFGQHRALARSLEGRLFFAGEATNTHGHIATVHGAMESAADAVEEIMEHTSPMIS
ncbi:MAG: flavin monoamine oxidase family protein [Bernardetiaceae bacterium]